MQVWCIERVSDPQAYIMPEPLSKGVSILSLITVSERMV